MATGAALHYELQIHPAAMAGLSIGYVTQFTEIPGYSRAVFYYILPFVVIVRPVC
jgi:hypothetical protein